MNVEQALFLFGLNEIDKKEIRKRYLRKCREYHPDKHINSTEEERREYTCKFNELQEAYILLNKEDDMAHMMNDVFHKNIFALGLKLMRQIQTYEFREEHIYSILELLDDESLKYIYKIIQQHSIFDNIKKWIEIRTETFCKLRENVCEENICEIRLYPTLYDMWIKKFHLFGDKYYIPYWHRYLCMHNLEITIEPLIKVGENKYKEYNVYHLFLDNENDLHIYVVAYLDTIFIKEEFVFDIYLGENEQYKTIRISVDKIAVKKDQIICLKREGIPRINKNNIYDDTQLSDIVVYLQLTL
jgi:hypothetical protein